MVVISHCFWSQKAHIAIVVPAPLSDSILPFHVHSEVSQWLKCQGFR